MEIITLSGKVVSPCEMMTDRNGNQYVRFIVSCVPNSNKKSYNIYRCITCDLNFRTLAEGDIVFLVGDIDFKIKYDSSNRPFVCNDVFVKSISRI